MFSDGIARRHPLNQTRPLTGRSPVQLRSLRGGPAGWGLRISRALPGIVRRPFHLRLGLLLAAVRRSTRSGRMLCATAAAAAAAPWAGGGGGNCRDYITKAQVQTGAHRISLERGVPSLCRRSWRAKATYVQRAASAYLLLVVACMWLHISCISAPRRSI